MWFWHTGGTSVHTRPDIELTQNMVLYVPEPHIELTQNMVFYERTQPLSTVFFLPPPPLPIHIHSFYSLIYSQTVHSGCITPLPLPIHSTIHLLLLISYLLFHLLYPLPSHWTYINTSLNLFLIFSICPFSSNSLPYPIYSSHFYFVHLDQPTRSPVLISSPHRVNA